MHSLQWNSTHFCRDRWRMSPNGRIAPPYERPRTTTIFSDNPSPNNNNNNNMETTSLDCENSKAESYHYTPHSNISRRATNSCSRSPPPLTLLSVWPSWLSRCKLSEPCVIPGRDRRDLRELWRLYVNKFVDYHTFKIAFWRIFPLLLSTQALRCHQYKLEKSLGVQLSIKFREVQKSLEKQKSWNKIIAMLLMNSV